MVYVNHRIMDYKKSQKPVLFVSATRASDQLFVKRLDAAIVVPGRSHYPEDIVEVIAAVGLRDALGVKENDRVSVEVAYD